MGDAWAGGALNLHSLASWLEFERSGAQNGD
jgi:hypothetical protein